MPNHSLKSANLSPKLLNNPVHTTKKGALNSPFFLAEKLRRRTVFPTANLVDTSLKCTDGFSRFVKILNEGKLQKSKFFNIYPDYFSKKYKSLHTALELACFKGDLKGIKFVIEQIKEFKLEKSLGSMNDIFRALIRNERLDAIKWLLNQAEQLPFLYPKRLDDLLECVVKYGNKETREFFLEKLDVLVNIGNVKEYGLQHTFEEAFAKNELAFVKNLLERNLADPNIYINLRHGILPLEYAQSTNNTDLIKILSENGAKLPQPVCVNRLP